MLKNKNLTKKQMGCLAFLFFSVKLDAVIVNQLFSGVF